ncbi:M protein [Helicobacter pylori]
MGSFFSLGKFSNDTQENSKDAQKSTKPIETTELTNENTKLKTEKTELNSKITGLSAEKDKLDKEKTDLTEKNKNLTTEKERLERENKNLTADRENLTTALSKAESQASQTSQKLNELERRHAPYQKLEKLYEVFLEVKDRLNFGFVEKTHSAMDLIASVLSDSKYYLESLYNKASQELSDKRSDKGEKLAELFDLLFEYVKDNKFERLKEPSAYDYSCKKLYPEQNTSGKMQRVVLRGYTYDKKIACYTIVDMGS